MTTLRPLGLLCALLPAMAFAQVEKAEKAVRDLEYPEALKALEVARKQAGNDRATTLRIYELQAITLATLGQDAKALKAFQVVFSLVPDFKLNGNYPPRVTTVFYEARSWVDQNKPIIARQLPAVTGSGLVTQLKVEVTNDPLKLIKEVRFHLISEGKISEVDVPFTLGTVVAPANVQRLSWWAELLGEKKAVLKELSSASSPRIEAAAPLPVAVKPKSVEPKPDLKPQPQPEAVVEAVPEKTQEITAWEEPAAPMPGKRVASFALMGGGVAVAGLGLVFGAMSNGTKAKVTGAATDSSGRVIGLTQKDALTLDAQQRTEASLANVFIISGAALAAGGVTLFILSLDETKVALVPAAGGVSVAGTF
ncbi:MAG: hypothetical protein Q8N23_05025 [Archangium sp.]|nr:hypothetical protein [Archangium sp.]MDP3571421.1 hypothetical protein [Archangium sp.]